MPRAIWSGSIVLSLSISSTNGRVFWSWNNWPICSTVTWLCNSCSCFCNWAISSLSCLTMSDSSLLLLALAPPTQVCGLTM